MQIGVTGASGFVGSSVCVSLRNNGHRVQAITRADLSLPTGKLQQSLENCDWVINCAGSTRIKNEVQAKVNTHLPPELYTKLIGTKIKGFLHVSSVAAIQSSSNPGEFIDEGYDENPDSDYGRSKLKGDEGLRHAKTNIIKMCILRPPILYGAKASGVFGMFRKSALLGLPMPFQDLDNLRNFMFVNNFAHAALAAIEANLDGTYITVDHDPLHPCQLYDKMTNLAGRGRRTFSLGAMTKPVLRATLGDRASSLVDNACYRGDLFNELTGYRPEYSPDEALSLTMSEV